jgi:hypothetical protein
MKDPTTPQRRLLQRRHARPRADVRVERGREALLRARAALRPAARRPEREQHAAERVRLPDVHRATRAAPARCDTGEVRVTLPIAGVALPHGRHPPAALQRRDRARACAAAGPLDRWRRSVCPGGGTCVTTPTSSRARSANPTTLVCNGGQEQRHELRARERRGGRPGFPTSRDCTVSTAGEGRRHPAAAVAHERHVRRRRSSPSGPGARLLRLLPRRGRDARVRGDAARRQPRVRVGRGLQAAVRGCEQRDTGRARLQPRVRITRGRLARRNIEDYGRTTRRS